MMMTAVHFHLTWRYRHGDKHVRRGLFSSESMPCIEAARLLSSNPYTYDIEVHDVDTGRAVNWSPPGIGRVLVDRIEPASSEQPADMQEVKAIMNCLDELNRTKDALTDQIAKLDIEINALSAQWKAKGKEIDRRQRLEAAERRRLKGKVQ